MGIGSWFKEKVSGAVKTFERTTKIDVPGVGLSKEEIEGKFEKAPTVQTSTKKYVAPTITTKKDTSRKDTTRKDTSQRLGDTITPTPTRDTSQPTKDAGVMTVTETEAAAMGTSLPAETVIVSDTATPTEVLSGKGTKVYTPVVDTSISTRTIRGTGRETATDYVPYEIKKEEIDKTKIDRDIAKTVASDISSQEIIQDLSSRLQDLKKTTTRRELTNVEKYEYDTIATNLNKQYAASGQLVSVQYQGETLPKEEVQPLGRDVSKVEQIRREAATEISRGQYGGWKQAVTPVIGAAASVAGTAAFLGQAITHPIKTTKDVGRSIKDLPTEFPYLLKEAKTIVSTEPGFALGYVGAELVTDIGLGKVATRVGGLGTQVVTRIDPRYAKTFTSKATETFLRGGEDVFVSRVKPFDPFKPSTYIDTFTGKKPGQFKKFDPLAPGTSRIIDIKTPLGRRVDIDIIEPGTDIRTPLKTQAEVAGTTIDAVSAQRGLFKSGIPGIFERRKALRGPIPGEELLTASTKKLLEQFDAGTLSTEKIIELNKLIQKETGSKGLVETTFFADPTGKLRKSRLGLDNGKPAGVLDVLSGDVTFKKKAPPQALLFERVDVAKFPKSLDDIKKAFEEGRGNQLTASQRDRLTAWQLESTGGWKAPGFIGPEPEITSAQRTLVKEGVAAVTLIDGKRVKIFASKLEDVKKVVDDIPTKIDDIITIDKKLAKADVGKGLDDIFIKRDDIAVADKRVDIKRKRTEDFSSSLVNQKYVSPVSLTSDTATALARRLFSPTVSPKPTAKPKPITPVSIGVSSVDSFKPFAPVSIGVSSVDSYKPVTSVSGVVSSKISPKPIIPVSSGISPVDSYKPVFSSLISSGAPYDPVISKPVVSYPVPTPKPLPKVFPTKKIKRVKKKKEVTKLKVKKPGYYAYGKIKKSKVFKRLNRIPVTEARARDIGSYTIDHSLAATWKIKKADKIASKTKLNVPKGYYAKTHDKYRDYKIRKGKKIPMKDKWIEKRGISRLDTRAEVKKITLDKKLAEIRKPKKAKVKKKAKSTGVNFFK